MKSHTRNRLLAAFLMAAAADLFGAGNFPEYGRIPVDPLQWKLPDGGVKSGETMSDGKIKFSGTDRLIYQFPAPISFRRILELKLPFSITTADRSYNIRILLVSTEGGVAFWGPSHVTSERMEIDADLKNADFSFYQLSPNQAEITRMEIRTEWNEHPTQTDISVGKGEMLLAPEVLKSITAFRDVSPGERLSLQFQKKDSSRLNRVRCRLTDLSGKNVTEEKSLPVTENNSVEYLFPSTLPSGFHQLDFLPEEIDFVMGSWTVYVRPAVEILAFDADRVCCLPGEDTKLTIRLRNNLDSAGKVTLILKTTDGSFGTKRTVTLNGNSEESLTSVLPPGTGDRWITAEVLLRNNPVDRSALRLEAGAERSALSRPARFYVNVGRDDPASVAQMTQRIAGYDCAGLSTPGMVPAPEILELSRRYKLPLTGEGVLQGAMISRCNLGSCTPDGVCWDSGDHMEDKTLLGCRKRYEQLYRLAPGDPRVETKIVEPVDLWWGANGYEMASYSIDAIRRFREILAGKDEGLRVLHNRRFIKRINFREFYRFYEGQDPQPAEFGLDNWHSYTPIAVPALTLPQRTDLVGQYTEQQLREIQLLNLLRRYVNTQLLDHLSQFITGGGQSCGIIPSFYANITGRDYYFSYALPYLDNYYHEPFDSARLILESYEFKGDGLKRVAEHFGKRQSLCLENGQPQCAVYWGTRASWIMVFAGLAAIGGNDLQIDFWERLSTPEATRETFDQHKSFQDAFCYFRNYPSETCADSREIAMVTYNLREHIRFMDEYDSANRSPGETVNPRVWREPRQLIETLKRSGARINFLYFWEVPGFSSAPPAPDRKLFFARNEQGEYREISGDIAAKRAGCEVKSSIDAEGMTMLFRGKGNGMPLHLAMILDREIPLWRKHYHKRPEAIPDYRTMDRMEEELHSTPPIECELSVPLEPGNYQVIDVFTAAPVAAFTRTAADRSSRFVVPGIKLAGFFRIEKH